MAQKKVRETEEDLRDLAELHLEIGDGEEITGQHLFNVLRDRDYEIDHVDSEVENYFSDKETGLQQTYELTKGDATYELHVRKEEGRMKDYWFEE